MDDSKALKQRNFIKAGGSFSIFLATVMVGDPNELIVQGPGYLSGFFLFLTVVSFVALVLDSR